MSSSLLLLSDSCQPISHLSLSLLWDACLTVEVLVGSVSLIICGRMSLALDWPHADSLANLSTFSFPLTLLWLEIHLTFKLQEVFRVWCRCRSHHGIMVTGDTGTGTVLKIQTRGYTMTHHCGITGFWWVTSLSYFPEFFQIFKLIFSYFLSILFF